MKIKKCVFNDIITIHPTYSKKEYDRSQIDSTIYKKCYQRISEEKWKEILFKLQMYKNEMILHINCQR